MPIKPLETLLAVKAINLAPGLLENDRRVTTVLIEHFNRRTGRCDPGIERIAALLGCSTRTVIRAVARLEKANIIRKVRHGGYSNRNSYAPNWAWFHQQGEIWRQKMRARAEPRGADVSPFARHSCHVETDSAVTQTYSANPHKKTCSESSEKGEELDGETKRLQWEFRPRSSSDAALVEAERRWSNDLLQAYRSQPVTYAEIIELIDEGLQTAATKAELTGHGAGLRLISSQLRLIKTRARQRVAP